MLLSGAVPAVVANVGYVLRGPWGSLPEIDDVEREVLRRGRVLALRHGSGVGVWPAYWSVATVGGSIAFDAREPRGTVVALELPVASPGEPGGPALRSSPWVIERVVQVDG